VSIWQLRRWACSGVDLDDDAFGDRSRDWELTTVYRERRGKRKPRESASSTREGTEAIRYDRRGEVLGMAAPGSNAGAGPFPRLETRGSQGKAALRLSTGGHRGPSLRPEGM
jgi:hypothetical protein